MTSALAAYRTLDDSRHRAEFYRMWRAGYSASFTHPATFESMGARESPQVEDVRQWLLAGTVKGRGVEELMRAETTRFDEFERALLALGEESGRFEDSLRLLAEYFTRKHKLMLWVKKQMAYPLFTGLAACFIAPFPLLYFGYPRAYMVSAVGAALTLLAAAGSLVLAVARSYGRKPAMARARFARGLATAIEAGLPLGRALRLAGSASANDEIRAHFTGRTERDLSSRSIVDTLAGCPYLTPEFMAIVDTAERTGDFGAVTRLAELYEDGFR